MAPPSPTQTGASRRADKAHGRDLAAFIPSRYTVKYWRRDGALAWRSVR
jgi:hypothetical protein